MQKYTFEDKENILQMHRMGYSYKKIASQTSIPVSSIANIVRLMRNPVTYEQEKKAYNQNQERVEDFVNAIKTFVPICHNLNQVCMRLNMKATNTNYKRIKDVIDEYNISIKHFVQEGETRILRADAKSLEDILQENVTYNSAKLLQRLIRAGLKEHRCEGECGNKLWNGKPIPLQLHHKNGIRTDNRLENLMLLCPNCHAQTDNYCGRNISKPHRTYICKNCGKEFQSGKGDLPNSTFYCCQECKEMGRKLYKRESHVPNSVDKETLIEDFKRYGSFVGVGRFYGISDIAIRKHFKKFGLPTSSREMKILIKEI